MIDSRNTVDEASTEEQIAKKFSRNIVDLYKKLGGSFPVNMPQIRQALGPIFNDVQYSSGTTETVAREIDELAGKFMSLSVDELKRYIDGKNDISKNEDIFDKLGFGDRFSEFIEKNAKLNLDDKYSEKRFMNYIRDMKFKTPDSSDDNTDIDKGRKAGSDYEHDVAKTLDKWIKRDDDRPRNPDIDSITSNDTDRYYATRSGASGEKADVMVVHDKPNDDGKFNTDPQQIDSGDKCFFVEVKKSENAKSYNPTVKIVHTANGMTMHYTGKSIIPDENPQNVNESDSRIDDEQYMEMMTRSDLSKIIMDIFQETFKDKILALEGLVETYDSIARIERNEKISDTEIVQDHEFPRDFRNFPEMFNLIFDYLMGQAAEDGPSDESRQIIRGVVEKYNMRFEQMLDIFNRHIANKGKKHRLDSVDMNSIKTIRNVMDDSQKTNMLMYMIGFDKLDMSSVRLENDDPRLNRFIDSMISWYVDYKDAAYLDIGSDDNGLGGLYILRNSYDPLNLQDKVEDITTLKGSITGARCRLRKRPETNSFVANFELDIIQNGKHFSNIMRDVGDFTMGPEDNAHDKKGHAGKPGDFFKEALQEINEYKLPPRKHSKIFINPIDNDGNIIQRNYKDITFLMNTSDFKKQIYSNIQDVTDIDKDIIKGYRSNDKQRADNAIDIINKEAKTVDATNDDVARQLGPFSSAEELIQDLKRDDSVSNRYVFKQDIIKNLRRDFRTNIRVINQFFKDHPECVGVQYAKIWNKFDNWISQFRKNKKHTTAQTWSSSGEKSSGEDNDSINELPRWKRKEIQINNDVKKLINSDLCRIIGSDGKEQNKKEIDIMATGQNPEFSDITVSNLLGKKFSIESKLNEKSAEFFKFTVSIQNKKIVFSEKGGIASFFDENFPGDEQITQKIKEFDNNVNKLIGDDQITSFYKKMYTMFYNYSKYVQDYKSISEQMGITAPKFNTPTEEQINQMIFPESLKPLINDFWTYLNFLKDCLVSIEKGEFQKKYTRSDKLIRQIKTNLYNIYNNKDRTSSVTDEQIDSINMKTIGDLFDYDTDDERLIKTYEVLLSPVNENKGHHLVTIKGRGSICDGIVGAVNDYYFKKKNARYVEIGCNSKVLEEGTLYIFNGDNDYDPMNLERYNESLPQNKQIQTFDKINNGTLIFDIQLHNWSKKDKRKQKDKKMYFKLSVHVVGNKIINNGFNFILGNLENNNFVIGGKDDNRSLNESFKGGVKTSDSKSDKFENEIAGDIQKWLKMVNDQRYQQLSVESYTGQDRKYYSDISITNPQNNKRIWIEVKLNKYANLGGPSFTYSDNSWHCSTTDDNNPLTQYYLDILTQHSQTFIDFCHERLGDDMVLPRDLPEVMDEWRKSGNIQDTDNDVLFITEKVELEDFGQKITQFYKTAKREPVYYIQIADDLFIIDPEYNPLNIKTHDGNELVPLSTIHRKGRIQFRAKGIEKMVDGKSKYFYSIVCDVKILADDVDIGEYNCSFKTSDKYPVVAQTEQVDEKRVMDYKLKDKEDTYRPDRNNYAFKNRSDKYGGDDYITSDDIFQRIHGSNVTIRGGYVDSWFGGDGLDEKTSRIFMVVDDGNDTRLPITSISRLDGYKDVIVMTSDGNNAMKTSDFATDLDRKTERLGRNVNSLLVYFNDKDESVYICNQIKANGNDVDLMLEWGDAIDYQVVNSNGGGK